MHVFYLDILLSQLSVRGVEILRAPHEHVWGSDTPDQEPAGVPAVAKGPPWSAHMLPLYTTDWCQSKAVQMFSVLLHHGQQSAKQSETALFSHTLQGFSLKYELLIQTWNASTELKIFPALRKSGWESGIELFNNVSALRLKYRQKESSLKNK